VEALATHSLWQVPEAFRRTPYVGSMAFLWGTPLGFGCATANVTAAFLVTFLAALAVPPGIALATGVASASLELRPCCSQWGTRTSRPSRTASRTLGNTSGPRGS
jgi:hypothetical protein